MVTILVMRPSRARNHAYLCTCLAIAGAAFAQSGEGPPTLIRLGQAPPRPHDKLKLPKGHTVGPTIPGLREGAIPQGLAFWVRQNWLLISCYFPHEDGRPSVVVAIDAKTGKLVRCLTLVEDSGKAHTGHVGGLAVSNKYLWVGSGQLYRAPLKDIAAAKPVDHLRLQKLFHAECDASYVAYDDKRVWVGEFVTTQDEKFKGNPAHHMQDRNGTEKYAWACGYALDADENVTGAADGSAPAPAAVLSTRQSVQGMAFLEGRIVLSTSFGGKDSVLAAYSNPLAGERSEPDKTVKVGDTKVPLWFLDGKNKAGKEIEFAPMSEGITAVGKRLAVICESGAEKYQKDGHTPLDNIIILAPLDGK
jgi:hypothetical protein